MLSRFCCSMTLAAALSGCATAFNSPTAYIIIQPDGSELTGASVWLNGKPSTVDSLRIESKANQSFGTYIVTSNTDPYTMGPGLSLVPVARCVFCSEPQIVIKKAGFKDKTIPLQRRVSPLFYANALNLFGFAVDLYSGFMWRYEPAVISVKLEKEPQL